LHDAVEAFYSFFWREYCDWYLELIKPRMYNSEQPVVRDATVATAVHVMKGLLQLLHPLMPFITEEVWQKLRVSSDDESIMITKWPVECRHFLSEKVEKEMEFLQSLIGAIRNIRGEMNVPPGKLAEVIISGSNNGVSLDLIKANRNYFSQLAKVDKLECSEHAVKPPKSASAVVSHFEIFLPLEGLIDFNVEKERLQKEITRLERQLESLNAKLQSNDFLNKAPEEVIGREKKKKTDFEASLAKLKTNFESLTA
jgi:valyl-tRNA synthetase